MTTALRQRPAIRARDVVLSETTKIITHPATLLAVLLALAANTLFAIIAATDVVRFGASDGTGVPLSAFPAVMFAPVYAFLVLPVYAAASEYHDGQLRMSFSAVPDRNRLVTGKLAAAVGVAILAALVALVPARLILGLHHGLIAPGLLADMARWVGAYLLMSLFVFGLAGVLRSTIAPLVILAVTVTVIGVNAGLVQWPEGVRFLPDQAAMNMLGTPAFDVTELPPAIGALALGLWSLVAICGYAVALIRRDS